MENDKPAFTEAQAQIEKLKKLKEQKDRSDKIKKEEEFRFAELPHAVTNPARREEPSVRDSLKETEAAGRESRQEEYTGRGVKTVKTKRTQSASRLDRKNLERIKKTVKKIKESGSGMRLSNDMFVNIILEKILGLKIDFSQAKALEEVRAIINKIKAE